MFFVYFFSNTRGAISLFFSYQDSKCRDHRFYLSCLCPSFPSHYSSFLIATLFHSIFPFCACFNPENLFVNILPNFQLLADQLEHFRSETRFRISCSVCCVLLGVWFGCDSYFLQLIVKVLLSFQFLIVKSTLYKTRLTLKPLPYE